VSSERFQTMLLSSLAPTGCCLRCSGFTACLALLRFASPAGIRDRIGTLAATKPTLMRLVARQAALPVPEASLPASRSAFVATRYVRSLLYETSAADPAAIAASIGLLVVAAFSPRSFPRAVPLRSIRWPCLRTNKDGPDNVLSLHAER